MEVFEFGWRIDCVVVVVVEEYEFVYVCVGGGLVVVE